MPLPPAAWPRASRLAWRISKALLVLQLVGLCWWSTELVRRFALTWDFSIVNQAVALIARGRLDPFSTAHGYAYWRDHAAFAVWPLALVYRLYPHPITLCVMQDVAVVCCEWIALRWLFDLASSRTSAKPASVGALGCCCALAVATSPWILWACSFDVHVEPFSVALALGAARSLHRSRRSYPLWAAATLASGDIGATYLAAIGLAAVVTRRSSATRGAAGLGAALAWLGAIAALHANLGTPMGNYAELAAHGRAPSAANLLAGVVTRPGRALAALARNGLDLYANAAQGGFIGLAFLPLAAPAWIALLESGLGSVNGFADPGFQNVVVAVLLPVATAAVLLLATTARRRWWRRAGACVGVLLLANAAAWAAVFLPRTATTWLRVSPAAARTLSEVSARIAPRDEVVAWQGIAGAFSGRRYIYPVLGDRPVPLRTGRVWVIVAPAQGIETVPVVDAESEVARLESTPHCRLVASGGGIWAFLLRPRGRRSLPIGPATRGAPVPAWTTPGPSGKAVEDGPARDWYVASTSRAGYVVSGDYWREPAGSYSATVSLSATGMTNVELWDATRSLLLARDTLPATNGPTSLTLTGVLSRERGEPQTAGWGIWRFRTAAPAEDELEVRVWSPGGGDDVAVYSIGLLPSGRS